MEMLYEDFSFGTFMTRFSGSLWNGNSITWCQNLKKVINLAPLDAKFITFVKFWHQMMLLPL